MFIGYSIFSIMVYWLSLRRTIPLISGYTTSTAGRTAVSRNGGRFLIQELLNIIDYMKQRKYRYYSAINTL
jgi:hypothetical protein